MINLIVIGVSPRFNTLATVEQVHVKTALAVSKVKGRLSKDIMNAREKYAKLLCWTDGKVPMVAGHRNANVY